MEGEEGLSRARSRPSRPAGAPAGSPRAGGPRIARPRAGDLRAVCFALPLFLTLPACSGSAGRAEDRSGGPPGGGSTAGESSRSPDRDAATAEGVLLARGEVDAVRSRIETADGPILVNFWALWCGPCVAEMPDLASLRAEFAPRGFEIVGISADLFLPGPPDTIEARVRKFLADGSYGWPNVLYSGRQDDLFEAFDLPGPIPVSLLLDRDGREVHRWIGMVKVEEARAEIAKLLPAG